MAARKKRSAKKATAKKTKKKAVRRRAARADDHDHASCRNCGTMPNHERLMRTVPGYIEARARCEEHAWRAAMAPLVYRTGCTKIPVVVHVVWRNANENISDAQIESQIKVLNEDFRKKNADVSTVPAAFASLAEDARVVFELATRDPDGNPTDGIVRKQTNVSGFDPDDSMKSAAAGGSDAWPADQYLNIWVCRLTGGLLGYAQFPGGPAETDGVVVTPTAFGTTGTAAAPFDKGRTTTHEVGHWLNLRHIWGDDGSACFGSDNVADTPNQAGPNTGVPTYPKVSCGNAPHGDMFMNYMDYTDDAGMVMFTRGQVARMQAALDGPRSAIGTPVACEPIGPKPLPKDGPKDPIKEFPKDGPKDFIKDPIKESPKDGPKDFSKDIIKEFPKDGPKDFPKDIIKEFPKDGPKDFPKDIIKELPKDGPKDFPFDPGPKTSDPGPKVFDPGPKAFDPGPKGFDPGPIGGVPFVLATGASAQAPTGSGCGCSEQTAALQGQVHQLQAYVQQLMTRMHGHGGNTW